MKKYIHIVVLLELNIKFKSYQKQFFYGKRLLNLDKNFLELSHCIPSFKSVLFENILKKVNMSDSLKQVQMCMKTKNVTIPNFSCKFQ